MTDQEWEEREKLQQEASTKSYQSELLGGRRSLDTYTVEKFRSTSNTQGAFDFAKSFNYKTDNLYLFGPTGSGKSHLAAIAARKMFEVKVYSPLKTISQMDISRTLRACKDAEKEIEVIKELQEVRTLVIEDLGVAKDTEFMMSTLYEIINSRYQNRPGGLIVTSNLSLGDLAKKFNDDRIPSRLAQMCKIFDFTGEKDRRIPEKK